MPSDADASQRGASGLGGGAAAVAGGAAGASGPLFEFVARKLGGRGHEAVVARQVIRARHVRRDLVVLHIVEQAGEDVSWWVMEQWLNRQQGVLP